MTQILGGCQDGRNANLHSSYSTFAGKRVKRLYLLISAAPHFETILYAALINAVQLYAAALYYIFISSLFVLLFDCYCIL